MALRTGRFTLGPADGTVLIRTGREGAAARVGHDLTLAATRWRAVVHVDARVPTRSTVRAVVEAASLEVREASGGALSLTESQKVEIEEIIREKVLRSPRHPKVIFTSTAVEGGSKRALVKGDLTIAGRTREAAIALHVDARSKTTRVRATMSIVQTDFGITPHSALLGALRVKDAVELSIDIRLPEGSTGSRATT
jgi:polyisoprenoid-binding protein YceI